MRSPEGADMKVQKLFIQILNANAVMAKKAHEIECMI